MLLTVVTPATSHDLVRLDDVRAQLGIADSDEDENLARWISQASGAVTEHLNRVLARETLEETFRPATRSGDLMLARYPVVSIASVIENGKTLAETDYEFASDTGMLTRLRDDTPTCWPPGKIVIEYVAGYALDDVPEDIARAVITLVSQYRYSAERDPQLRSEAIEGAGSSSYFDGLDGAGGMSPEVLGLIAKHRQPAGY